MKKIEVVLRQQKETLNTWRFSEETDGFTAPKVGTLYIPKSTLKLLGNPDALILTLATED